MKLGDLISLDGRRGTVMGFMPKGMVDVRLDGDDFNRRCAADRLQSAARTNGRPDRKPRPVRKARRNSDERKAQEAEWERVKAQQYKPAGIQEGFDPLYVAHLPPRAVTAEDGSIAYCGNPIDSTAYYLMLDKRSTFLSRFVQWKDVVDAARDARILSPNQEVDVALYFGEVSDEPDADIPAGTSLRALLSKIGFYELSEQEQLSAQVDVSSGEKSEGVEQIGPSAIIAAILEGHPGSDLRLKSGQTVSVRYKPAMIQMRLTSFFLNEYKPLLDQRNRTREFPSTFRSYQRQRKGKRGQKALGAELTPEGARTGKPSVKEPVPSVDFFTFDGTNAVFYEEMKNESVDEEKLSSLFSVFSRRDYVISAGDRLTADSAARGEYGELALWIEKLSRTQIHRSVALDFIVSGAVAVGGRTNIVTDPLALHDLKPGTRIRIQLMDKALSPFFSWVGESRLGLTRTPEGDVGCLLPSKAAVIDRLRKGLDILYGIKSALTSAQNVLNTAEDPSKRVRIGRPASTSLTIDRIPPPLRAAPVRSVREAESLASKIGFPVFVSGLLVTKAEEFLPPSRVETKRDLALLLSALDLAQSQVQLGESPDTFAVGSMDILISMPPARSREEAATRFASAVNERSGSVRAEVDPLQPNTIRLSLQVPGATALFQPVGPVKGSYGPIRPFSSGQNSDVADAVTRLATAYTRLQKWVSKIREEQAVNPSEPSLVELTQILDAAGLGLEDPASPLYGPIAFMVSANLVPPDARIEKKKWGIRGARKSKLIIRDVGLEAANVQNFLLASEKQRKAQHAEILGPLETWLSTTSKEFDEARPPILDHPLEGAALKLRRVLKGQGFKEIDRLQQGLITSTQRLGPVSGPSELRKSGQIATRLSTMASEQLARLIPTAQDPQTRTAAASVLLSNEIRDLLRRPDYNRRAPDEVIIASKAVTDIYPKLLKSGLSADEAAAYTLEVVRLASLYLHLGGARLVGSPFAYEVAVERPTVASGVATVQQKLGRTDTQLAKVREEIDTALKAIESRLKDIKDGDESRTEEAEARRTRARLIVARRELEQRPEGQRLLRDLSELETERERLLSKLGTQREQYEATRTEEAEARRVAGRSVLESVLIALRDAITAAQGGSRGFASNRFRRVWVTYNPIVFELTRQFFLFETQQTFRGITAYPELAHAVDTVGRFGVLASLVQEAAYVARDPGEVEEILDQKLSTNRDVAGEMYPVRTVMTGLTETERLPRGFFGSFLRLWPLGATYEDADALMQATIQDPIGEMTRLKHEMESPTVVPFLWKAKRQGLPGLRPTPGAPPQIIKPTRPLAIQQRELPPASVIRKYDEQVMPLSLLQQIDATIRELGGQPERRSAELPELPERIVDPRGKKRWSEADPMVECEACGEFVRESGLIGEGCLKCVGKK